MHAFDIDHAPLAVLEAPADLEVHRQPRGADLADRYGLTVRTYRTQPPDHLPRADALLIAQASASQTASSLAARWNDTDDRGGISQEEIEALEALLGQHLGGPVDDPALDELLDHDPEDVMSAARALAESQGNHSIVLETLVDLLAGQNLWPRYPKGRRDRKPDPVLNPWLEALTATFFTPDILEAAVRSHDRIRAGLERYRNPTTRLTPDGRPMPRKRDLDAAGRAIVQGRFDHSISLSEDETRWAELAEDRARFLFALAEHHYLSNSLVNTFECLARGMKIDFDVWLEVSDSLYQPFLDSATFMVLSAHQTNLVMSLYDRVPLDLRDLQRLIIAQIERRTQIYARADLKLSNNAAISQALGDLLNTLVEDPSIDEILPAEEKIQFLKLIGNATLSRSRFREAIGVYTALGDMDRLREIGDKLSNPIYYQGQQHDQTTVNRDVGIAIEAYREAADVDALKSLLDQCRQAEEIFAALDPKPVNYQYLAKYIRQIEDFVSPSGGASTFGLAQLSLGAPEMAGLGVDVPMSPERLRDRVRTALQEFETAVPGQDVDDVRRELESLGDQALEMDEFGLAATALGAVGAFDEKAMIALGRNLLNENRYFDAYTIFELVGAAAYQDMIALGQAIVDRGLAPRGILNPEVELAVDAYLAADESARLEALVNELLKLRAIFESRDADAISAGRKPIERNTAVIGRCIDKVLDQYDLVGLPDAPPQRTVVPLQGPTRTNEPSGESVPDETELLEQAKTAPPEPPSQPLSGPVPPNPAPKNNAPAPELALEAPATTDEDALHSPAPAPELALESPATTDEDALHSPAPAPEIALEVNVSNEASVSDTARGAKGTTGSTETAPIAAGERLSLAVHYVELPSHEGARGSSPAVERTPESPEKAPLVQSALEPEPWSDVEGNQKLEDRHRRALHPSEFESGTSVFKTDVPQ